jgi:hypothetical protein
MHIFDLGGSMSTRNDYSAEEWKTIAAAPVVAGLFITLSDASGLVGTAKEAMAVGRAITESAASTAPEVVKAVAESVRSAGGRPELPDIPKVDRAAMKTRLITHLKAAASAVEAKSPSEGAAYKAWLLSVATNVSQAAKEGGFFGIGGTQVSAEEQEALTQLAQALGIPSSEARWHSDR